VAYIAERAKSEAGQPFFLYFPMTSPHTPIAPSKEFLGKSGLGPYVDFVMETDWCVGEILRAVEQGGITDNTLVIFTADNGTSTRAEFTDLETKGVQLRHQFRGNKADIYEGGHRVPFVAKWDGEIEAGSVSDEVVCLPDFMATAAELVGYELPADAAEDSVSLWPLLRGEGRGGLANREAIINHSIDGSFAVRRGKWKLCFSHGSAGWSEPKEAVAIKSGLPPIQLFNLESDIKEQENVYRDHPEVVEELTQLLKKYIEDGRSTPGARQPNDEGENWWAQLPWELGE
jgi:arylsulfatase A